VSANFKRNLKFEKTYVTPAKNRGSLIEKKSRTPDTLKKQRITGPPPAPKKTTAVVTAVA